MKKDILIGLAGGLCGAVVFIAIVMSLSDYFVN
jgi:hypothetical protein